MTQLSKAKLQLNTYVHGLFLESVVACFIEIIIIGKIVFYPGGTYSHTPSVIQAFLLFYIPLVTLIVPLEMFRTSRKQYPRGRWKIKPEQIISGYLSPLVPS